MTNAFILPRTYNTDDINIHTILLSSSCLSYVKLDKTKALTIHMYNTNDIINKDMHLWECKSKTICIYANVSANWLYNVGIKIKC